MVYETPYVVMFQQVNILSGNPEPSGGGGAGGGSLRAGGRIQECWNFEHPRRDMITNEKGEFQFKIQPLINQAMQDG